MEFNGQYLIYEDYRLLGGTLDLTPFNLLEFEARKKIDERTQGRLKNVSSDDMPMEVKLCMFALINTINNYKVSLSSASKSGSIASETIDGYSVTYTNSSESKSVLSSRNDELNDIIMTYLLNVVVNNEHVLYLGVN